MVNACSDCAVRDLAICHALTDEKLSELGRHGRRQKISRGQTLLWEGDDSLLVGNVIDGVLKLSTSTWDGREQTLGIVYSSDFIGRPFGTTSNQSVTAMTDAQVCTFPRSDFDAFARENPGLEHKLLERTLMDLDHARAWMLLLGKKSATERIATFLLEMADRLPTSEGEHPGSIQFELPFGRQDIADLLGLTIETVSRQITGLREAGIVATPGKRSIEVLDREALEESTGH